MNVAVSSQDKELDSQVDPRFGRAPYLLIVDADSMTFEAVMNGAGEGGAGIQAAKTVIDAGVQAVLTGNCGPNAEKTLRAAGVKLFTGVSGTVVEAIQQHKDGKLAEASGPSVPSHFGAGA